MFLQEYSLKTRKMGINNPRGQMKEEVDQKTSVLNKTVQLFSKGERVKIVKNYVHVVYRRPEREIMCII